MSIPVVLNVDDMTWVEQIAHLRQDEAVRAGRPDRHGYDGKKGYDIHRLGAAGELAACKALDLPWEASVNTFKAPDAAGGYQFRTRKYHDYDLLVRPEDRDDEVFIHVTGEPPNMVVHGWLLGRDAKQPQWKKCHGGRPAAYFVPADALNQLGE